MECLDCLSAGLVGSGLAVLYVALANVGGLVPPFLLCESAGSPGVHLGANGALVYSGGCTPYGGALAVAVVTILVGLALVGAGLWRLHRVLAGSRETPTAV